MKILHLTSHLSYTGAGKHLALLSLGLPRPRFEVEIGVLQESNSNTGYSELLRGNGIPVHVLGKDRRFDLASLWRLRRLVHSFQPDVIHTWGQTVLCQLFFAASHRLAPIIAADVLPTSRARFSRSVVDGGLLRLPARLITRGAAEADRYLAAGIRPGKIAVVPPTGAFVSEGRSGQTPTTADPIPAKRSNGNTRFALCAGVMELHKGFRDAIWALDILRFLFEDLDLMFVGDGPDRPALERFARSVRLDGHTSFVGSRADISELLHRAEVVWIPSLADCGRYIALEALAAGKPVVASDLASLREIIDDGETGFLIRPGNKPALARRTTELLRGAQLRHQFADAGRARAARFSLANFLNLSAVVYVDAVA